MKELNKVQNIIFRIGGVLFLVGVCAYLYNPFWGMVMYTLGVLMYTTMQMLARYDGSSITLLRLRRQQLFSDLCFLLSAAAMMTQVLRFMPEWLMMNSWIMLLVVGCVMQVYTAFRIPSELDKESKRNSGKDALLLLLILPFAASSCATQQYNVNGTTNVSMLEGNKLYLKSFSATQMSNLDSCIVQHGRITFCGALDSTQMVIVFMDNEVEMPMVLEEGFINLTIDEYMRNVTGSPLNDTLYNFIRTKNKLDNEMEGLMTLESKLIMDGVDPISRDRILYQESQRLIAENDKLITSFIVRNSDNVLGPGVFMFLTSAFPFPQLNPQIEEILFRAKPAFKNHPYVKSYIEAAKQNMDKIHMGE